MSVLKIKKAFETRLNTLTPAISTAYEGVNFTPQSGIPYQRVFLVPRLPDNPTMGDDHYRETGEFQIFLCYPINSGTGAVLSRAVLLQNLFKRGTDMFEDGIVVNIRYTPQISGTTILGDRVVTPVIVRYESDIF